MGPTKTRAHAVRATGDLQIFSPEATHVDVGIAIDNTGRRPRRDKRKTDKQKYQIELDISKTAESNDSSHSSFTEFPTANNPSLSKRAKRKTRKQEALATREPVPNTDLRSSNSQHISSEKKPTKQRENIPLASLLLEPMPPGINYPLLVASLGNPGPRYVTTLHSAGHIVLRSLQVQASFNFKPWERDRNLANGLVSGPDTSGYEFGFFRGLKKVDKGLEAGEPDITLWQSPSLMNVSGKAVSQAWRTWSQNKTGGRLVIVHDELESAMGKVTIKKSDASAKGHNGLKSVQQSLPGKEYWRIAVGIGRPQSRNSDDVANYVLKQMNKDQGKVIEGAANDVWRALLEIADGAK